jgi:Ca2+-binding RTX toxin-like protein
MAVIVDTPVSNMRLVDQPNQSNTIIGDVNGTLDVVGGNDRIFALEGNDIVIGDALVISASGRGGNDLVYGGDGVDTIYGDARLTLRGLGGNDTLFAGSGGAGRQVMYGDVFALRGAHGATTASRAATR